MGFDKTTVKLCICSGDWLWPSESRFPTAAIRGILTTTKRVGGGSDAS